MANISKGVWYPNTKINTNMELAVILCLVLEKYRRVFHFIWSSNSLTYVHNQINRNVIEWNKYKMPSNKYLMQRSLLYRNIVRLFNIPLVQYNKVEGRFTSSKMRF
jgi:hypothetical protein